MPLTLLALFHPFEFDPLLGQGREGSGDLCESMNEWPLVTKESQDLSNVMDVMEGTGPFCEALDLGWVNAYLSLTCDPSKEINAVLLEDTFGWLEVVVAFLHLIQEGMNDFFVDLPLFWGAPGGNPPVVHVVA